MIQPFKQRMKIRNDCIAIVLGRESIKEWKKVSKLREIYKNIVRSLSDMISSKKAVKNKNGLVCDKYNKYSFSLLRWSRLSLVLIQYLLKYKRY